MPNRYPARAKVTTPPAMGRHTCLPPRRTGARVGLLIERSTSCCGSCWVITFVEILRRDDLTRGAKAAWSLIVLLLPVVGVGVYLIVRPTKDERFAVTDPAAMDERLPAQHPF
jgi:hypothetical protein